MKAFNYFGIGFGLMLIMIIMVYGIYQDSAQEKYDKEMEAIHAGQESMMTIELVMSKYAERGMVTNLKVSNNSQKPAYGYIVETELFDDKGVFIGECSAPQIKIIQPNKSENIEVFCEERWSGWYKKVKNTNAKFRNTTRSYTVTVKPDEN
jgi:hypothetical protein